VTDILCGTQSEARYRSSIAWGTASGLLPNTGNTTRFLWQLKTGTLDTLLAPATPAGAQVTMTQPAYDALIAEIDVTPFYRAELSIDTADLRSELITEIWSGDGFPSGGVSSTQTGVASPASVAPSNLLSTNKLTIICTAGDVTETLSNVYMWFPTVVSANGDLAIMHTGHTTTDAGWALVEAGYTVIGMHMPFGGADSAGTVSNHDALPDPTDTLNYLRFFVEPSIRCLNEFAGSYTKCFMVGHSGGGYTTNLVAALDTRLSAGASSSGSFPLYFPDAGWSGARDWEQELNGLTGSYLDLYIMACDGGRKLLNSYNTADTCCFLGTEYNADPFETLVQTATGNTNFEVLVVTNSAHEIHADARAAIIALFDSM
jgi:hypothetical protein